MKRYVLLLCVVLIGQSIAFFTKNELPTKNGAKCLDGSPAAIYVFEPDSPEKFPNNLLVMFEENIEGWCF
jgi:hypothetical protein